jgi:lambda family phage portal protein
MINNIKFNAFDKLVGFFDPKKATKQVLQRSKMQNLMEMSASTAYDGASTSKRDLKNYNPQDYSADAANSGSLKKLRARASDLTRNDPTAAGVIGKKTNSVVGKGMRLDVELDSEVLGLDEKQTQDLENHIEREFTLFTKGLDVTRTQSFGLMQNLALRSCYEMSDSFAYLPMRKTKGRVYQTSLQLIESHRVSNPGYRTITDKIRDGVEIDEFGAPTAYHVSRFHPGAKNYVERDVGKWDRIPAFNDRTGRRNMVHLFAKKRIGQNRGVSLLAPVVSILATMSKMTQAELFRVTVQTFFTAFIVSETGQETLDQSALPDGQEASSDPSELKMAAGGIMELDPDTDIKFANPPSTSTQFDQYMNIMLKLISMAIEVPFEMLTGHFQASYSAARAAMLEAYKHVLVERQWFADMFLNPIYEAFFVEAVLIGRIEAPGFFEDPAIRQAYLGCEWIGSARGMIDETKEVKASVERINAGLSTAARETQQMTGQDWYKVQDKRKKELDHQNNLGLSPQGSGESNDAVTLTSDQTEIINEAQ